MSNFKPGDPALIIKSRFTENIGRQVELVSRVMAHPEDVPQWLVRASHGELRALLNITGTAVYSEEAVCRETSLMPLRGDGGDEILEADKPQEVMT